MNLRDVFPTTPGERIAMTLCYALVALGAYMVTHPYQTGAAITKALVAAVEIFV